MASPPVIRTFPSSNNVAVWYALPRLMLPVVVNVPAPGSYSSALVRPNESLPTPPAMRTFPLGNKVAVWLVLAAVMLPAGVNVPLVWSYSSALARVLLCSSPPPAMRTFPLGNKVAVWSYLATVILPVGTKIHSGGIAPAAPFAPAVELVAPPVAPIPSPLPLLHPVAPTLTTKMIRTVTSTKTEHREFNMWPPVWAAPAVDGYSYSSALASGEEKPSG